MLVNAQATSEVKMDEEESEGLSCVSAGTLWRTCVTERPLLRGRSASQRIFSTFMILWYEWETDCLNTGKFVQLTMFLISE